MKTVQDIMAENGSLANIERFQTMQKWEYKRKVEHAQEMAEAFYYWAKEHDKGVHLSVGVLDEARLPGRKWQLVRMGARVGLHRHWMGRCAGTGHPDVH